MTNIDVSLVQDAQNGNQEAFSRLYNKTINHIYRYIRKRVPTQELAEDLTSETYLAVVERLKSFRGEATFLSWVYQIARRRIADHWRRHYRLPEIASDLVIALASTTSDPYLEEESEAAPQFDVRKIIDQLDERQRQVLECRFLQVKSIKETAEELNLSEANVKVIQHRAIAQAIIIAKKNL